MRRSYDSLPVGVNLAKWRNTRICGNCVLPYIDAPPKLLLYDLKWWPEWSPTARVQRILLTGLCTTSLQGVARLSFTARIEGAHSDRAASASKKDGLAVPLPPFQAARSYFGL